MLALKENIYAFMSYKMKYTFLFNHVLGEIQLLTTTQEATGAVDQVKDGNEWSVSNGAGKPSNGLPFSWLSLNGDLRPIQCVWNIEVWFTELFSKTTAQYFVWHLGVNTLSTLTHRHHH